MRVAYLLGTSAGGTAPHVRMLAEGCAARGVQVSVHGPAAVGGRYFQELPFVPVEVAERPRPASDLAAVLRLRRILRRSAPDVVHAHGLRAGAFAALALAGARRRAGGGRAALAVTVHNAPPPGGPARAVHAVLERIVAHRADTVTCVSGDLTARMRHLGARDGGRALVPAPPAAEPSPQQIVRARADLRAGDGPAVLAVGRLAGQKGFTVLLAAAARWQHRSPVPVLAIAGDGPLGDSLRAQADRARLAVRFLGRRDDVPALLAAADVIVVTSTWEGQPLIVQEILRAARPLVAFRVGGIPELTGEDGALLVPPGDVEALAAAVLAVLDDPARAAVLASAARARAAALPRPDEAVESVLALYQRLTAPAG